MERSAFGSEKSQLAALRCPFAPTQQGPRSCCREKPVPSRTKENGVLPIAPTVSLPNMKTSLPFRSMTMAASKHFNA